LSSELAKRYAKALFRTAADDRQLEVQAKCLEAIEPLLKHSSQFLNWMAAPQITENLKAEMLERNLGGTFDRKLLDFLLFLLKKGRFQELPDIVKEYRRMVAKKLGILDVRLITTVPIDEPTKDKLAQKLEAKYGLKPRFHDEIDPALIGGSVIVIGSQEMDNSVRGRLLRLKKHLLRGTS
jgi:F-type H+-transporting ATPase subunit delta